MVYNSGLLFYCSVTNKELSLLALCGDTPTKIIKLQSPISQKLGKILERTGSMFYFTIKSIFTKVFMITGCILSKL